MINFPQKKGLAFVIFLMISTSLFAQNMTSNSNEFWQHVRFGGGIGLSFGNGFFSGTLAPSAIYEFNEYVALGVGLNGTYSSRKNYYSSTVFGGSLIGLFSPIREIQLSAELEELNVNRKWDNQFNVANENYWYPALFLGAAYRSQNVSVGIRFDVLYDKDKSIYGESWMPFVRVYF